MALGFDWRGLDHYLNIEDMCEVLRDNGMSVQTANKCNSVGKNEVHFWIHRNGRTLHRILYEYDLGGLGNIQKHRRYFLEEIIDTFEAAEKADVARVHIMGICEMLAKLDDRGFKAKSDYDPGKKVYRIWAHKGDWHCVREVEWCDVLDADQATIATHARHRQDILESIFEAYKEYERIKEKEMKDTKQTYVMAKKDADYLNYGVADVMATMGLNRGLNRKLNPTTKLPEIKKVVFNNPATIVIWADDTKTVVKAQNDELFDPEKGLAMAITKKALGNEGRYFDVIKKHVGHNLPERELIDRSYKTKFENLKHKCVEAFDILLRNDFDSKKATKAELVAIMKNALSVFGREISENEN